MTSRPNLPGLDDEAMDAASYVAEGSNRVPAPPHVIAAIRARNSAIADNNAVNRDKIAAEINRAIAHYDGRLRTELEAKHMNMYATIDAETGDYVIASRRFEASALFRKTYGTDRASWTLHIGTT